MGQDKPSPKDQAIGAAIGAFSMLKYFPADEFGKAAVMGLLSRMTSSAAQVSWLAQTIVDHYNEWPGPQAIRAVFCTRFKPADGVEADLTSGPYFAKIEQRLIEQHERNKALELAAEPQRLVETLKKGLLQ